MLGDDSLKIGFPTVQHFNIPKAVSIQSWIIIQNPQKKLTRDAQQKKTKKNMSDMSMADSLVDSTLW
jgi:hypothetical protein